ncbi:MAG: DUF1858 domain-containing protein [Bacteroidota bacterium]
MTNNKLVISPKTKISQLLEEYPHLENILIGYVPAFEKLKNPVLRKTIGKVATLQQAAAIGQVKTEELINKLRKEAGQDRMDEQSENPYTTEKPGWFNKDKIADELDIREMLAAGEHPVNQIMEELKKLPKGKIYKVTAPFLPAPMIDKATALGIQHYIDQQNQETIFIYFCK